MSDDEIEALIDEINEEKAENLARIASEMIGDDEGETNDDENSEDN